MVYYSWDHFKSFSELASSPGRFFANITAGENFSPAVILVKNRPGDEAISE